MRIRKLQAPGVDEWMAVAAVGLYLVVSGYAAVWIFDVYMLSHLNLSVSLVYAVLIFFLSAGTLAAGAMLYLRARRSKVSLFFLWMAAACGSAMLTGMMGRYFPPFTRVYFSSISMLAAFAVGFHLSFPVKVSGAKQYLVGAFCLGGSALSTLWLLDVIEENSSFWVALTYGILVAGIAVSVFRMIHEVSGEETPEYRWIGRTLASILGVGFGFVFVQYWLTAISGQFLLPFWVVPLVVALMFAGYVYVLFTRSPQKGDLAPRAIAGASTTAILFTLDSLAFWFLSAAIGGLAAAIVLAAISVVGYRILMKFLDTLLYKGWYRHDALVERVIDGLSRVGDESTLLDEAAKLLRFEMKLEEVCVQDGAGCRCWDGSWRGHQQCTFEHSTSLDGAKLLLGKHIDGSGLGRKDIWALNIIGDYLRARIGRSGLTESESDAVSSRVGCPLSAREMEVLELMAEGLTNKEIAQRIFTSVKTVEHHVTSIYRKLGVDSRVKAVLKAERSGWLQDTRR